MTERESDTFSLEKSSRNRRRAFLKAALGVGGVAGTSGCLRLIRSNTGGGDTTETTESDGSPGETTAETTQPDTPATPTKESIEGSWPSFQRGPQNTGAAAAVGPGESPDEKWRTNFGSKIYPDAGCAIDEDAVYLGTYGGSVHALDSATGTQMWEYELGGDSYTTPAVTENTVVVGSTDKKLHAIRRSDGSEKWTYTTGFPVNSHPTIADGTVYASTQSGPRSGGVVAIDLQTGEHRWRFDVDGEIGTSVAVDGDTAFVGSGHLDHTFYALDANTGTERWSVADPMDYRRNRFTSAAVGEESVFVGFETDHDANTESRPLLAIGRDDGTVRWQYEMSASAASAPAVADGTVYVSNWEGKVTALDAADGTVRWALESKLPEGVRGSPVVGSDAVYVGNHRITRKGGEFQGTLGPGQTTSQSALAGRTLVYHQFGGSVFAVTREQ